MSSKPFCNPSEQLRTYHRDECVVFHTTKDTFGGLSNMAAGFQLRVNGVGIRTSEALYQACRFPHLPDVQRMIINERSPMIAKGKSKPFRSETRDDWDLLRHKIMRWCLRVKLAQNYETFGRLLLETGDRHIVEQSSKDDFWGAYVRGTAVLVGHNVLGRLLMELRERLKCDSDEQLRMVEPLPVHNFLLLGEPIQTVNSLSIDDDLAQHSLC